MDSDPNLDLDLDLELTPDDVPTPDAIGLCLQLCEEEITKERCLPINVVVADVRRYVRDPLVKKAVTAQFDDDNADMFDVVFCEPESDPNIWMKAVLPPSAYEDVYKARIRTGTLIRIDRVKLYLKQHKNSTAASNVIIIQDMRVLRQDCDVGLDEDRMDEPTRTRLYTPLLETRLYYIAMHNSTDVLARDPKWKSELDVERPKTIQVSNLDDILQNGVKKKLTIYGRVVAKQRLMQHATMDAKHLAPIRGSFTIAGISSSSNAEGSTSTKMRVVLWDVAAMKHYNGVQLGSVVSIDGYRLKPFWSASKNEDEDDLCGMEVSVNSSTPTGHVRVVAPNPASKNITKFLKRFPTQKYHFGWPRDTPRPIYANCDLIGVLLYVGRPLVTVSRDTHNVLKPSQHRWLQLRHPKEPDRTVSIQLFSLSNPQVWDSLLPGQLFACTCMRLEQKNSRRPNTTTKGLHVRAYYVNTIDTQIQMRENKIFEYKDTVDGIDPPAPQDDGLQSINRTTNGSTAHTADGTTEGTSTRTPAGDGPVHLSEGIERLNESDEIGSQSSESDYDSEAERVVPVGTKNNQSVRDGEGGGGGIDRHTHTHSKTTQNKDSAETRDGTGVQPGGAETDGCKRLRRSSRQLNWNENEDVKQISPNGRRRNRSEGESPHRSTHTGINIRKRTKQADHHSHKDGHSKHAQQAPDLADIFTTREGRAVRRWAETDAAKALVTRALCSGRYIPMPLPLRYEWYCSDRKTLDDHDPYYDVSPIDEVINLAKALRYQECRRFVIRGTITKLELCTPSLKPDSAYVRAQARHKTRNSRNKVSRLSERNSQSQSQSQDGSQSQSQSMSKSQDSYAGKHGYVPTSVDVSAKANCATHLPTSTDTVLSDIRESDDDNRPILDPSAGYYWIVTVRTLSQEPRAASIELLVTLTIEQTQRLLNMEPTEEVCGPNPMSWIVQALPPHTFNEETEAAIAQSTSVEALTPTAKECISTHLTDKRMMFVIECYQGLCEHPEVSLTKAYPLQLVPEGVTDS